MKETCSFNDGLFFIWPLCVALASSSVIVVMLVGFHFLRKADKVESISENTNGYLMDNDTIFILSTVGVIVRKCIVLVFSLTVYHSTISVNALACTFVMVEIYYQTILIISLKTINIKKVKALQNVVLCLMLPNCLWWMYDRFLSLKPDLDEANDLMIGLSWDSLRQAILPLCGFYRFQAFVLLYRLWKTWKSEIK